MRILVVSPRYTFTGVALAQFRFARALAKDGHDVELIYGILDNDHLPENRQELPRADGVVVRHWSKPTARQMFGPLRAYMREREPEVIFSAEDHLNDLVLLAAIATGYKGKVSGSSRVFPLDQTGHYGPYSTAPWTKRWAFKQLTSALSSRAASWTCVSEDLAESYRSLFNSAKFTCVHNIIVDEESLQKAKEPVDHEWFGDRDVPVIVSAGTLTLRKGLVDLIRAVRHLHDQGRHVRLALLGEGPMRGELSDLTRKLSLSESVWFAGRVENPLKYFAHAPVSALASYSEGLPNVLVESMMCGCVPVATDCPTGPREVLQDGKYGYLVPMHDPAALAGGIADAIDKPVARETLREGIRSFEARAVIDRHFDLLGLPTGSA
jgi:glycosyltransferase involved in cell wall biosynthesis